ncbi:MAG: hypothetical protein ABW168_02830 [Sedimenticola sp.]
MDKSFNHYRIFFFIVALMILAGCARKPIGIVSTQTQVPLPTESILVQGVKPTTYEVVFIKGRIVNGKFKKAKHVGIIVGSPNGRYLVGKAQAGDVVALIMFLRPKSNNGQNISFRFCGKNVLVFTVPEGKVVYLGDISIKETGRNSFNINYSSDFNAAKEYIDANYPALRGRLDKIAANVMQYECPPAYEYIMIYK